MKALIKRKAQPGLWLEDVPDPKCGLNDVLIRIERTGICGTDLHIYKWDAWAQKTIPVPMVVGHEFVGTVVAVGENVNDFFRGEIVSGEGHVVCGRCRNCLAGRRHLCAHTSGIGVNRPGRLRRISRATDDQRLASPPGIDLDVASIFDPLGNAVHTALRSTCSAKTCSSPAPVRSG
jgi:threonine 3-dehydrogenase